MNMAQQGQLTLVGALWPAERSAAPALRVVALMLVGTALLWLSGKIQVPLWPVPITMQTFAVLTLGVAYGTRLGAATLALYLLLGALGLPLFAGGWTEGGGVQHFVGPTAGYLVGFFVAAALAGWLAERGWDRSPLLAAAAMILGNLMIYALGVAWLATLIGPWPAVQFGLLPFLVGDALKVALAACALPLAWGALGRRRGR